MLRTLALGRGPVAALPIVLAAFFCRPSPASAQESLALAPDAHGYALIVGSNPGGAGQEPLAYAERDAERVAEVLVELGHYDPEKVELLRSPGRRQMLSALGRLRRRLEAHRARDEQTVAFIYYSGHARSQALHLGPEAVALAELRREVEALPSTLTLVVLDACQSGAYTRVRGAEPTADFSHNSVSQLQTRGVVIMASSSGNELSQESERLEAGYFTHHLLVALRGAADENLDGRVALDEAYRYAYARTLVDTSQTAVGGQHVSLETELTGHGAVALTYPAEASAHLELPEDAEGEFLITRPGGEAVMAELTKAPGAALRLALPAGRYQLLWRTDERVRACAADLPRRGVGRLRPSACEEITEEEARAREAREVPVVVWGFEVGPGVGQDTRSSAYTDRLRDFGYTPTAFEGDWEIRFHTSMERKVHPYLGVVVSGEFLEEGSWGRPLFSAETESFTFRAWGIGAALRATLPLSGQWLYGYAQAGGGLGIARSELDPGDPQSSVDTEVDLGYHLGAALGLRFMPWRYVGFYLQANYSYAPILENDLGDRHDSGGATFFTGLRVRLWNR